MENRITKKTKYLNKNCDFCLKDWYDGTNYITKTCDYHQEYSFERKLKELKTNKKDRKLQWVWWIFLMLHVLVVLTITMSSEISVLLKVIFGISLVGCVFGLSWVAFDGDKVYKWIIERDKKKLEEFEKINRGRKKIG